MHHRQQHTNNQREYSNLSRLKLTSRKSFMEKGSLRTFETFPSFQLLLSNVKTHSFTQEIFTEDIVNNKESLQQDSPTRLFNKSISVIPRYTRRQLVRNDGNLEGANYSFPFQVENT